MSKNEIVERIIECIELNSYIEAEDDDTVLLPEVKCVESFEEKHLCTLKEGVVVTLNDASEVYLTIQVYKGRNAFDAGEET